jgi:hypothetical protein
MPFPFLPFRKNRVGGGLPGPVKPCNIYWNSIWNILAFFNFKTIKERARPPDRNGTPPARKHKVEWIDAPHPHPSGTPPRPGPGPSVRAGRAFAWPFAFTGDSHDDRTGLFDRVLSAVDDSDMEFLVHAGDMVNRNTEEEWERFRKATASFRKPLYPVIGNHELSGNWTRARKRFAKRFGLPGTAYSFTHKNARFAILDNADGTLPEKTLSRLDRDLAAHPKGTGGISFPPRGDAHPAGDRRDRSPRDPAGLRGAEREAPPDP